MNTLLALIQNISNKNYFCSSLKLQFFLPINFFFCDVSDIKYSPTCVILSVILDISAQLYFTMCRNCGPRRKFGPNARVRRIVGRQIWRIRCCCVRRCRALDVALRRRAGRAARVGRLGRLARPGRTGAAAPGTARRGFDVGRYGRDRTAPRRILAVSVRRLAAAAVGALQDRRHCRPAWPTQLAHTPVTHSPPGFASTQPTLLALVCVCSL